jgi:hypothetical protein
MIGKMEYAWQAEGRSDRRVLDLGLRGRMRAGRTKTPKECFETAMEGLRRGWSVYTRAQNPIMVNVMLFTPQVNRAYMKVGLQSVGARQTQASLLNLRSATFYGLSSCRHANANIKRQAIHNIPLANISSQSKRLSHEITHASIRRSLA